MTKRDFKKKTKPKKAKSYCFTYMGKIYIIIGFIFVFGTSTFDFSMYLFTDLMQIIGYIIGAVMAFIGIGLDVIGEIIFGQEFKAYLNFGR